MRFLTTIHFTGVTITIIKAIRVDEDVFSSRCESERTQLLSANKEKKNRYALRKAKVLEASNLHKSKKSQNPIMIRLFYIVGFFFLSFNIYFLYLMPPLAATESNACIQVSKKGWLPLIFSTSKKSQTTDMKTVLTCVEAYGSKFDDKISFGFCCLFITMVSFYIPGSFLLSVSAGVLWSFPRAVLTVTVCSTLGSSVAYFFSWLFGKSLMHKFVNKDKIDKIRKLENELETKNSRFQIFYMLALLRCTIMPNHMINCVCPHIGVDPLIFLMATFVGLMPYDMCLIFSGKMLINSVGDDSVFMQDIPTMVLCCTSVLFGGMVYWRYYYHSGETKNNVDEKYGDAKIQPTSDGASIDSIKYRSIDEKGLCRH